MEPIIRSILDTDLYKLTQQQAVLFGRFGGINFQDIDVEYAFINRGGTEFPKKFGGSHYNDGNFLQEQIASLSDLKLTDREYRWLKENCPYLKRGYLDYLRGFRFKTEQVKVEQSGGILNLRIRGPWYETIAFEVMVMAIISELYFRLNDAIPQDNIKRAIEKAKLVKAAGLPLADFGTRRRFSYDVQDEVVGVLAKEAGPTFIGSSNVHLAMKHGVKAIGTHAHEFFMAHAALFGYPLANRHALNAWADEYQGDLGIALTDTFTTDVFFQQFDKRLSKLFDGCRHDSGDCLVFARKAIDHYNRMGIDPLSKTIVFSDGLTVEKAIEVQKFCKGKIKCSFGIGTSLSNDVGHKPLNMVIKLVKVNGRDVVKLSDVPGKETGTTLEIEQCKRALGIV